MHHAVIHDDFASKRVSDALMTEANSEERYFRPEGSDNIVGESGLAGRTWAWRNENALGIQLTDLIQGNLVIPADLQIRLHFSQVLDQVVSE